MVRVTGDHHPVVADHLGRAVVDLGVHEHLEGVPLGRHALSMRRMATVSVSLLGRVVVVVG